MTHSTTKGSSIKRFITEILITAFWLLVWELLYLYVGKEILVVSPFHAAGRLLQLAGSQDFWISVAGSCMRVVVGFFLALTTGILLAVLTNRFELAHLLLRPVLGIVKATPVASFIILALLWISTGRLPVFCAFLMVVPLVWANLHTGLANTDPQLLEMASVFRFSRWKKVRLIYIPALVPYFVAACSTGLGFAWKSMVAAEVISKPDNAIGTRIYETKVYLETADLFAWTIVVILLSLLLERVTIFLLGRLSARLLRAPKARGR